MNFFITVYRNWRWYTIHKTFILNTLLNRWSYSVKSCFQISCYCSFLDVFVILWNLNFKSGFSFSCIKNPFVFHMHFCLVNHTYILHLWIKIVFQVPILWYTFSKWALSILKFWLLCKFHILEIYIIRIEDNILKGWCVIFLTLFWSLNNIFLLIIYLFLSFRCRWLSWTYFLIILFPFQIICEWILFFSNLISWHFAFDSIH